jgi:hypothetical protein
VEGSRHLSIATSGVEEKAEKRRLNTNLNATYSCRFYENLRNFQSQLTHWKIARQSHEGHHEYIAGTHAQSVALLQAKL